MAYLWAGWEKKILAAVFGLFRMAGKEREELSIHRQVTVQDGMALSAVQYHSQAISITNMITGLNPSYIKPVIKDGANE